MTTTDEIQKITQQALANKSDMSCYLFGSYAKNKATQESDVDLLLIFDKDVYDFKAISKIKNTIKNDFEKIGIYCDPIYGYVQYINEDKSVLYREYIGYGILLYGDDISKVMIQESREEQKQIEYEKYWTAMYFEKIKILEYLMKEDKKIDESSLCWQYLYLVAYWYAKAQLTLLDKQHSLNEFTLHYIYTELLQWKIDQSLLYTLEILQIYRDIFQDDDYFDIEYESFENHFKNIKKLIKHNTFNTFQSLKSLKYHT